LICCHARPVPVRDQNGGPDKASQPPRRRGCGHHGVRLVSAPSSDRGGGMPAPYIRARRGAGAVERGGLEILARVYCPVAFRVISLGFLRPSAFPL
jgi:hypothetical protein